jgi:phage shock protein A
MVHRTEFNELKEQVKLLEKQVKNLRKKLKEVDSKQYVVRPNTGPR